MNNEETKTEASQEQVKRQSAEASTEAKQDEGKSIIEVATELRDEIRAEKKELREENNRRESLRAKDMLAGKTFAGQAKQKPKEETPTEYVDRIMGGNYEE